MKIFALFSAFYRNFFKKNSDTKISRIGIYHVRRLSFRFICIFFQEQRLYFKLPERQFRNASRARPPFVFFRHIAFVYFVVAVQIHAAIRSRSLAFV